MEFVIEEKMVVILSSGMDFVIEEKMVVILSRGNKNLPSPTLHSFWEIKKKVGEELHVGGSNPDLWFIN